MATTVVLADKSHPAPRPKVLRVLGGQPGTAQEADAVELVHDLSNRVLVKARIKLRKIGNTAPQDRQHLLALIQATQCLRDNTVPAQFQKSIDQLRSYLRQLTSFG